MRDHALENRQNTLSFTGYVIGAVIVALGVLSYLVLTERYLIALALVLFPFSFLLITHPRLAVFLYVFSLFILLPIEPRIPLFLTDLSALVVIVAALFDLFSSAHLPRSFPRLFFNFVFLFVAVAIAAVFGYDLQASLHPLGRILFLTLTFLSLYRLSGKVPFTELLTFFFFVTVFHSVITLIPFISSGGTIRSFGLAQASFDDFAMIALPVGLSLSLWSERRNALYLLGTFLIFGGLIATQSRASMFFALFALMAVLWFSLRRAKLLKKESRSFPPVKKRIYTLLLGGFALAAFVIAFIPGVFTAVLQRFESVMTTSPGGTVRTRLFLWQTAWYAFTQHPLLGVGPGSFRSFYEIFPTLHLNRLFYFVKGLSAHNLLLHYLAETGILGASALVALFVNQFRLARRVWKAPHPVNRYGYSLALFTVSLLFLVTTFLEAGWLWGQFSFLFVFFAALIVRAYREILEQ